MRIRRRNRKKTIDTRHVNVLSSDSAFAESAKALAKAQEIAEYNKDIDAIVAISDRWAMLARALDADENQATRMPIGFSVEKEDKDEHNSKSGS
jgi:ABC-type sugar transport system substrate-binding protein